MLRIRYLPRGLEVYYSNCEWGSADGFGQTGWGYYAKEEVSARDDVGITHLKLVYRAFFDYEQPYSFVLWSHLSGSRLVWKTASTLTVLSLLSMR